MSSENVELARRIYSAWERGDYSESWWAADDIDFDLRFVPQARVRGIEAMGEAWYEVLRDWRSFSTHAVEFRDLGDRVLVLTEFGGEGRRSGISVEAWRGFAEFTIEDGKVTRLTVSAVAPEE